MITRHMAKVAGAQGARERPLRPPSGPSRAARTPVRERVFNRMDRVFKQNEHSLGCSSWIVAIQSLSGDSRRSAWRTCQHQLPTSPSLTSTQTAATTPAPEVHGSVEDATSVGTASATGASRSRTQQLAIQAAARLAKARGDVSSGLLLTRDGIAQHGNELLRAFLGAIATASTESVSYS